MRTAQEIQDAEAAAHPDCARCQEAAANGDLYGPRHDASTRCRSGGYAHCTCDTCF